MRRMEVVAALLVMTALVWANGSQEAPDETTANDDPVVLKLLVEYHSTMPKIPQQDLNDNEIINWLKENSGYEFDIHSLPREGNKLPVILASGEYYDAILINNPNLYRGPAAEGAYRDLGPYLAEAEYLTELIEPAIWEAAEVNGTQFGIPQPRGYDQRQGNWVRADVLDEAGATMPRSIEEYVIAFRAMKEAGDFPAGFAVSIDRDVLVQGFAGAFGVSPEWVAEDGELVYFAAHENAKDYVSFLKRLYDEELLDQEFGINTDSTVREKLASGAAFAAQMPWWSATSVQRAFADLDPNASVEYMPAPVGPEGDSGLPYSGGPWRKIWVSPMSAKHTAEFVGFMDWMANLDNGGINTISFGIEGKHWEMVDGVVQPNESASEIEYRGSYNVLMPDTGPSGAMRRLINGHADNYNAMNDEVLLEDYSLAAPTIDAWVNNRTVIADYTRENHVKFIMGERPMSEYDDFVDELMDRGLAAATGELNAWYQSVQ